MNVIALPIADKAGSFGVLRVDKTSSTFGFQPRLNLQLALPADQKVPPV